MTTLCAAAIALAAPAAAAARTIVLQPGQGLTVAGTTLVCTYGGAKGTSGGLGCRTQNASGPIVGSYSITAAATTVGVYKFTAPTKAKFAFSVNQPDAKPAPAFIRDYFRIRMVAKASAGDEVALAGTSVVCQVARGAAFAGVLGIRCGLISGGRYAIAIDQTGVSVHQAGQTTPFWQHKHGAG
ncbi:MAG: hypothetical protein ACJ768_07290 [Gaiellaceae bacterium]